MKINLSNSVIINFAFIVVPSIESALIANCKCGEENILQNRIFGGETVLSENYPWIAYIQLQKPYFCGGVVINDVYILTADHCMEKANGLNFTVYLRTSHRTNNKGIEYRPVEIVRFQNSLGPAKRKDVALIKLDKKVMIENVQVIPICLPNPNSKYTNLNVSVLGWGKTASGAASNLLKKAELVVMSNDYCMKSGIGQHYDPDLMLCAYGSQTDACQGDSGGPLFYNPRPNLSPKYELIGLVSWGIKCGSGAPGVYSKISYYLDWIVEKTKDANYCPY